MERSDEDNSVRLDYFAAVSLIALAIEGVHDKVHNDLSNLTYAVRTLSPHGDGRHLGGGGSGGPIQPAMTQHALDVNRAERAVSLAIALAEVLDNNPKAPKIEVTIEVLGGVVDKVDSTGPVVVKVIDHDNENTNENHTTITFGSRES